MNPVEMLWTDVSVTGKLILVWLAVLNVIGFVIFGYDKHCAVRRRWRVPEKTLFIIALLGGSLGSYAGMYVFRHKTRHWKFKIGIPVIILLQCCCWLIRSVF